MRFYTLFIKTQSPKLKGIQITKVFPKHVFNRRPPTYGPSIKRRIVDFLLSPYLASFVILHFVSSLIQSMDQQPGLSIYLRSVDTSRRFILRFSLTSGTGHFFLIGSTFWQDGLSISQRTIDPSISPHLVKIPRVASRCLNLQTMVTTYGLSMAFVGHFCTNSSQPSAFWFWTTFVQNKDKTY